MFTCETDDGIPAWKINGTVLNDLPPETRDDIEVLATNTAEGTTVQELTIPDIVGYNGTRAQCLVVDIFGGSTAESETVTMRIQGISRMQDTMHCWLATQCICVLQFLVEDKFPFCYVLWLRGAEQAYAAQQLPL